MTRQELRTYALEHRNDDDVIKELITRANPNRPRYPYPQTEADLAQMEEIFRRKIAGDNSV
jgi:hypothetical protein